MNAARIERSDRLQRVLQVLTALPRPSSLEIQEIARVTAPGTCVSELRHAGYRVECKKERGIFYYTLVR